jgi:hypothetical protein
MYQDHESLADCLRDKDGRVIDCIVHDLAQQGSD